MSEYTSGQRLVRARPTGEHVVYIPAESGTEDEKFYNGVWLGTFPLRGDADIDAAAPELLEALQNLVRAEELFVEESGMILDDLVSSAVECARLAIAKAEGRS